MPLSLLEGVLGGIGLFLLGMRLMSDGIRTVADARIRSVFAAVTSNRFNSMVFGIALALALNSSGAAVILALGLANGGVLNVFQALNLLAGTLVGASLSLYLPEIPYSLVATPAVFAGALLKFFAHRRRFANVGDLLLGAGLLFLGLALLEGSFRPSDNHPFYELFKGGFLRQPMLVMLFGAIMSWFVQSSLSVAALISSLVGVHYLSPDMGALMMVGGLAGVATIGIAVSLGGKTVARRVAAVFFAIVLFVVVVLGLAVPYLPDHLGMFAPLHGKRPANGLLVAHGLGSMLCALITLAFSGVVSRWIGAGDDHGDSGVIPQPRAGYLDMRIINTPTLAIEQARKEIVRMVSVAAYMYADTRELLFEFDARRADTIRQHEQVLDALNHEITAFLAALAHSTGNPDISFEIPGLLQVVSDLEHIGDRCENILDCIIERKEAGIYFSSEAMADLKLIARVAGENVAFVEALIRDGFEPDVDQVRSLKDSTRDAIDQVKQLHFDRLCAGACPPRAAMLFNELNADFSRIAELCWNLMAVRGRKMS